MRTIAPVIMFHYMLVILLFGVSLTAVAQERREASIGDSNSLATDEEINKRVKEWIKLLGDDDYVVRETASNRLKEIGSPALVELKKSAESPEIEVRFQVERLIRLIEIESRKKRLEKFLSSKDPDDDCGLAGWKKFSSVVGNTKTERELFVELHESLPKALESLGTDHNSIYKTFTDVMRTEVTSKINTSGMSSRPVIRSMICCITMAIVYKDLGGTSSLLDSEIANRLQTAQVKEALSSGPYHVPFKKTVLQWLTAGKKYDNMTPRRMYIANLLEMKDLSLQHALLCLDGGNSVSSTYLGQAILLVGKHGQPEHLKLVIKFIDNTNTGQRAYMLTNKNSQKPIVPKISDHVAEAYVKLKKLDPQSIGLLKIDHSPNYFINAVMPDYYFDKSSDRTAGIKKLKAMIKNNPSDNSKKKSSRATTGLKQQQAKSSKSDK